MFQLNEFCLQSLCIKIQINQRPVDVERKRRRNDLRVESVCLAPGHADYAHDLNCIAENGEDKTGNGKRVTSLREETLSWLETPSRRNE